MLIPEKREYLFSIISHEEGEKLSQAFRHKSMNYERGNMIKALQPKLPSEIKKRATGRSKMMAKKVWIFDAQSHNLRVNI